MPSVCVTYVNLYTGLTDQSTYQMMDDIFYRFSRKPARVRINEVVQIRLTFHCLLRLFAHDRKTAVFTQLRAHSDSVDIHTHKDARAALRLTWFRNKGEIFAICLVYMKL